MLVCYALEKRSRWFIPGVRSSVCVGVGLQVPPRGLAVRFGRGCLVPRRGAAMVARRPDRVTDPFVRFPSIQFHSHPKLWEPGRVLRSLLGGIPSSERSASRARGMRELTNSSGKEAAEPLPGWPGRGRAVFATSLS